MKTSKINVKVDVYLRRENSYFQDIHVEKTVGRILIEEMGEIVM